MSCDNVITVQDLETDKKHSTFYREVITGKVGGIGADIDSATNAVTGQTQATLPKVLSNVGFSPAGFDFTTGGTLAERDKAIFYQPDGNWYSWGGTLPKVVPPASSPASTGGIADNAWSVSTSAFMYRDWEGFTAELLAQSGVPDNGQPDELGNSKRVEAIKKVVVKQTVLRFASVSDMLLGVPIRSEIGSDCCTGGTTWEHIAGDGTQISHYRPTSEMYVNDFGAKPTNDIADKPANTVAFQSMLDAALETNDGRMRLGVGTYIVGPLTYYRETKIKGAGRLTGPGKGASTIVFDLLAGEDGFKYSSIGEPNGGLEIDDVKITKYGFSTANPTAVLESNNRAIFANDTAPANNWLATTAWQQPKTNGSACPKVKLRRVIFEGFTWAWDLHTWMSSFEDLEFRYCGGTRTFGTSVTFKRCWPQYNLYEAYQVRLAYSSMSDCSLGEQVSPGGYKSNGICNYGGVIGVSDCGWENTYINSAYRCIDGRIDVTNSTHVTDKTVKANYEYEIGSASAVITVDGYVKVTDSDGDVTDPSYNHALFYAPEGINNLVFKGAMTANNLPYRYPHLSFRKNDGPIYRGLWANNAQQITKNQVNFITPDYELRNNTYPSLVLRYESEFLLIGVNSVRKLVADIFGTFNESGMTFANTKRGEIKITIEPVEAYNSSNGEVYFSEVGTSTYTVSWAHNGSSLIVKDKKEGTGFTNAGDLSLPPVVASYSTGVNDSGIKVLLGVQAITAANAANGEWTNRVRHKVKVSYTGSCNNNTGAGHSGNRLSCYIA